MGARCRGRCGTRLGHQGDMRPPSRIDGPAQRPREGRRGEDARGAHEEASSERRFLALVLDERGQPLQLVADGAPAGPFPARPGPVGPPSRCLAWPSRLGPKGSQILAWRSRQLSISVRSSRIAASWINGTSDASGAGEPASGGILGHRARELKRYGARVRRRGGAVVVPARKGGLLRVATSPHTKRSIRAEATTTTRDSRSSAARRSI